MTSPIPESPERFELVERIAVGGMAEVFKAKKLGSHGFAKIVAVKRILPSLASDPEFVRRFIAEANIAVGLSHANIVQIFDFSRFGESLYIAMEYVEGLDLAAVARAVREGRGHLDVGPALYVAMELLKGLDYAHSNKVVHRDISPSNILVSRSGEVKIADFGIAQAAGHRLTQRHRIMGKWRYMSPEQARGDKLDYRTDMFSAGVVLYELFTGHQLFDGDNVEQIINAINGARIAPPSTVNANLPPDFDRILMRMLERERDMRRVTAGELLANLVRVSYERSLPATAASLASAVEEFLEISRSRVEDTGPAELIDDIVNSELAHAKRAAGHGVGRRVTVIAPETPVGQESDDPANTTLMFVARRSDDEKISEWFLSEGTGQYTLKETARLFAIPDDPEPRDDGETIMGPAVAAPAPARPRVTAPAQMGVTEPKRRGRGWWWLAVPAVAAGAVIGLKIGASGGEGQGDDSTPVVVVAADAGASPPIAATTPPDAATTGAVGAAATADAAYAPPPADAGAESAALLTARSRPSGAVVYVDGKRVGRTPLRRVPLAAGSSKIRFVRDGYVARTVRAKLEVGETTELSVKLSAEDKTGTVAIYSEPWANVYYKGRKIGTAPTRRLTLPVGRHRLTLKNPVQKRSTTITVTVPSSRTYRVKLPAAEGR